MSSRPDFSADPEAPWTSAPLSPACRLLRWGLGAAALLVAVAGGAAIGTWVVAPYLAAPGASPAPSRGLHRSSASSVQPGPTEEPELTARLLARNVTLGNGTLSWYSHQGIAGVHLSPGLTYDEHRQELVVAKAGHYQVCLHLELSHVLPTSRDSGKVSLALHLEPPQAEATAHPLAVDLSPYSSLPVQGSRCQPLQMADLQRLSVHLSVYLPTGGSKHQAWQLAQPATQPATKLELFRLSADVPDRRLST
ncbi:tumor necrosis factor ligand superfamily member 9 [Heterocephalus glaber]|uniref:Tumor necrosis factor ligand superfamily member 9 n=1 Tax=Heterocephalus glaber TaxID=10181 RepID=A0AAX6Q2R4_HETGA|nr:tumor necrosis factor ligand superfamily member 9 [Heterocephalus glaber]